MVLGNIGEVMRNHLDQKHETHESYGILSLSRVTGTPRHLFGSTIKHGDTIVLKISECEVSREFQKSRYMDNKTFIEVEMSASQYAEAITTMNAGCGVPVTLRRVNGKQIQDPPIVDFKERAKSELRSEMGELAERINELSKDAKEILGRKGTPIKADERKKILHDITMLVQEVRSNIPFAHECFEESVEETVTEAKATLDAFLTSMRERLGQAVIDGKIEVPMLEGKITPTE